MQEFIEYVLDPTWLKKHYVDDFAASDTIDNSLLNNYKQILAENCYAPNEYLHDNQELLIDKDNKCLLLELFQKFPSNDALQLIEKTASAHPNIAASVVQSSIVDSKQLSRNFRSSIKSLLSYDFPVLSGIIVQELAKCTLCINTVPIVAAEFLVNWLNTTSVPNDTLFIVSKYFIDSYSNGDNVARISNYLHDERFSNVMAFVEEEFLITVSQGKLFQPLVFENFQNIIHSGKMNPFTVGFLAYGTKYEMYVPPKEAVDWFKFLLKNSMEYIKEDVLKADQMQEDQALLAFDALSSIAVLELKKTQPDLSFVSEIVKYVIENEYKFVQSKYRLKWVFYNLFEIWEKDTKQNQLLPIIKQITNHDETISEGTLHQLGLEVTTVIDLPKDIDTLLKELRDLNQENPTINQETISDLISYIDSTLKKIKAKHIEFGFDKYRRIIIHENYKKPAEILKNEIHLYHKGEELFFRIIDDNNMLLDFKANLDDDTKEYFKILMATGTSFSPDDYKIICKVAGCRVAWSDMQFQDWASNVTKVNKSNIAEAIAVLDYAYHLTVAKEKFFLRDHQILAILLLFKNPQGMFLEVETGGGKSAIIAVFNMIEALNGLIGHTITGTATLARRDAKEQKPIFDKFNITVSHNTAYSHENPNPCYSKKRVYCDIRSLLADNLRNLHEFIMEVSDVDSITVDEIDLLFIDQAIFRGTKIQLSSPIPGFEYLKSALQLAWSNLHNIRYIPSAIGYEYDVRDQIWKHPNNTEYKNLSNEEMNEWIKDHVIMSLSDVLDSPSLPVPKHLRSFVNNHIKRWANSALKAIMYEKGREYIIYDNVRNSKTSKIIAPVNPETGSIQTSLVLTDAFTQFLQIKEAIYQTAEGLTNVFTSYFGYFLRYKGRIFGLTGTVGKLWHQKFLYDVYSTPSIILPKFMPSKMKRFPMRIGLNQTHWLNEIIMEVHSAFNNSQAVLITTDYINEVHLITRELKKSGYQGRIGKYFDGKKHEYVIERLLRPGDVIVATGLGGRGTHISLARETELKGGMVVIETSYPASSRVDDQRCGRGARRGERGSCITIINAKEYPELIAKCNTNISCFHEFRDKNEIETLKNLSICSLPGKKLEDWLFQEHVRHIRISTSPTGLEIITLKGDVTAKELENQTDSQLYVYTSLTKTGWFWGKSESRVYLKAPKKERIDITDIIAKLDEKLLDHLRTVLSLEGMALNGRCYELIHFIAAYNGISTRSDIIARVIAKYEQLWSTENNLGDVILSNTKYKDDFVEPEEYDFLENLALQSEVNITDSEQKIEELKFLKFKELFRLWNEDRKLYNDQQFIRENNQQFGIHYKEHQYLMNPHPECNSSDPLGEQHRDQLRAEELRNKSESFFETTRKAKLRNPAYMLHQAFAYEQIDAQENWLKPNTVIESLSGIFSDSGYNIPIRGIYGFLPKTVNSFLANAIQVATGLIARTTGIEVFKNLQKGFMKVSDVFIPNALNLAYEFAQNASSADPFYNWWGKNALSYFTLRSKGEAISHVDDAQKAVDVMKEFGSHQNAAAYGLNGYTDMLEGYLDKMLMEKHVSRNSPFALHKKAEIEIKKVYIYIMIENVKEVRNVFNNFENSPSILRVKEVISNSRLINLVNVTAIREFYEPSILNGTVQSKFTAKDFNISDIENFTINITNNTANQTCSLNETCAEILDQLNNQNQAFSNLNSLTENPAEIDIESLLETTLSEMFAQGAFIFTVERQALEEDDDEWIGKLVSGIFGFVQIIIGAALLNPAGIASGIGVFATTLATGMIVSGIGDIISTLVAVINNTPIDVENYFKSKAINFAVTLITAGALHALSSIGSLRIDAMNRAFLKNLKNIGMPQYLTQHILFQAAMYGLGEFTQKQAKDYTKRNSGDIKSDAQKASTNIIDETYEPYLRKIFAYDAVCGTTSKVNGLESYAIDITADYSTRFQDSGTRIGKGVFGKVTGTILGGFGMMGQVAGTAINSATDLSFGFIKIAGASKDFKQKMISEIKNQASTLPGSKSMMQSYLEEDSSNAQAIMVQLNIAGFIISNEDIDYKNRSHITTFKGLYR